MNATQGRKISTLYSCLAFEMLAYCPAILSAQDALAPYVSVWAQLNPEVFETVDSPGSLLGEFRAAAKAGDDQTARKDWQRFVDDFDPQDGFFEDGMHARFVEWAKMELVRLQHRASGDLAAERAQIAIMRQQAERD
jgi:hypothetical protein